LCSFQPILIAKSKIDLGDSNHRQAQRLGAGFVDSGVCRVGNFRGD
jgi:hypothetical protein